MINKVKILLLQARKAGDDARLGERRSFARQTGLPEENIVPWDLLDSTPTVADVRRYDALMVGGSGDYYVSKQNLPGFPAVLALLSAVVDIGHPTFASCFGFQLMVEALGGQIVYDAAAMEVGTYELTLTDAGRQDALFSHLPAHFNAQLGHKDRAARFPQGAVNLASSAIIAYQALRIPDKPIWAAQFHPELTMEDNLSRFNRYRDGYVAVLGETGVQTILDNFAPSPEANALLGHFLRLVFT